MTASLSPTNPSSPNPSGPSSSADSVSPGSASPGSVSPGSSGGSPPLGGAGVGNDGGAAAILAALVAAAVLLGLATAYGELFALVGLLALAYVVAVARVPMIGVISILTVTPLLAAQERGYIVPGFRVHEAVIFASIAGVGLRALAAHLCGWGVKIKPHAVDLAFTVVAFTGSVVPALLMVSRGRSISTEGIGQLMVFPKYFGLYVLMRCSVRSFEHLRIALLTICGVGTVVSLVALVQTAATQRVNDLFLSFGWEITEHFFIGKTTSTIGNAILLGMYLSMLLAVSLSLLFRTLARRQEAIWANPKGRRNTAAITGIAGIIFLACLSTGQMSTLIAIFCAVVIGLVAVRRARYLGLFPLVGAAAVVPLWPVINKRIEEFNGFNELPRSWADRVANLRTHFLPELAADDNWFWSVRPETAKFDGNNITGTVFLESGYLAMLWIGGVFLLAAVVAFQIASLRSTWRVIRHPNPWVAAAATGAFVGFFATMFLMLIDSHLTFRGSADLLYTLLAFSLITAAPPLLIGTPSKRI